MAITFHPDGRITGATIQADVSGQLTNTGSGQILETIAATCDGRTVTVPSGSYTITNVTASQTGAATYADCNGSVINYTPPAGTKQLVYRYQFQWNCTALSGLSNFRIRCDGTVVEPSQRGFSSNYASTNWNHAQMRFSAGYTFDLNAGNTDVAQGKFQTGTWTSPKILKCEFRNYSTSYTINIHQNNYWEATSASGSNQEPIKPELYIQAIG